MADEADKSVELTERHQEMLIEQHREAAKKRELQPLGHCRWCDEPFEKGSNQLFCLDGCQEDYEKAKRLKKPTL